jgi:hypothetical protein
VGYLRQDRLHARGQLVSARFVGPLSIIGRSRSNGLVSYRIAGDFARSRKIRLASFGVDDRDFHGHCWRFKRSTGGGPHQWLLQRRIEVADELLRVLSVTDELAKTSWPDPDLRHSLSDVTPDLSQNQRDRIAGAGRI